MGSLSTTVFLAMGLTPALSPRSMEIQRTPLEQVLSLIHFIPMTWRKWLLDLSRIQADPFVNHHLHTSLQQVAPELVVIPLRSGQWVLTIHELASIASNFYDSAICCSILSYFVRAESTAFVDEFLEVKEETLNKEIKAALHFQPIGQQLNYYSLFGGDADAAISGVTLKDQQRLIHLWRAHFRSFKSTYSRLGSDIIYPVYNNKKTVGYDTQERLQRNEDSNPTDEYTYQYTTLSLLRHYLETGERVQGPLEVRMSWKFNDLKPRVYYCTGGEAFWAACYVRPICNFLIKAFPSTNPFSRFNVQRLPQLGETHFLVTYDYFSFTTCLEELQYFLFFLADSLIGVPMRCLDVRVGVVEYDVGEYLQNYNQVVNQHQEFDLRRFVKPSHEGAIYNQGRSGSLGVQGNIVFSTLLHGILLGSLSGTPDADSCVGDDALVVISQSVFPIFIEHIRKIGIIHTEKFTTFRLPPPDDPTMAGRQQFKYLKRPITVDFTGRIITGELDFFPSLADFLFPEGDGIHSSMGEPDMLKRLRSLCTQWGRFLFLNENSIHLANTLDTDLDLIVSSVAACYRQVGLSLAGGVPGDSLALPDAKLGIAQIDFLAPPCDSVNVFETNWVDTLLASRYGELIRQPVRLQGSIPADPYCSLGSRFRVTSDSKIVRLMVDLGFMVTENVEEETEFDNHFVRRFYQMLQGDGGNILMDVVVVKDLPTWYFSVAVEDAYPLTQVDVDMKLVELQSVSGISFD